MPLVPVSSDLCKDRDAMKKGRQPQPPPLELLFRGHSGAARSDEPG